MTLIENISLIQRILSSVKQDAENLGTTGSSIRAKLEILEGEIGIFRSLYEEDSKEESKAVEDFPPVMPPINSDIIDVENPVMADTE